VNRCLNKEVQYYAKATTPTAFFSTLDSADAKTVRAWSQSHIGSERPYVKADSDELEPWAENQQYLYSNGKAFEINPPSGDANCHQDCSCTVMINGAEEKADCLMQQSSIREVGADTTDVFFKRYTTTQRLGNDVYTQLIDGLEPETTYELRVSAVNATVVDGSDAVGEDGFWSREKNNREKKLPLTKLGSSNGPISYPLIFTTPALNAEHNSIECQHGKEVLAKAYHSVPSIVILKSMSPYPSSSTTEWKLFPKRKYFTLTTKGVALASIKIHFDLFDVECDHDKVEIRYAHNNQLVWSGGCQRQAFSLTVNNAVRIDPSSVPRPGLLVRLIADNNIEYAGIRFTYVIYDNCWLVGGTWLVVLVWWYLVGGTCLVVLVWWYLFGGTCLVALVWWSPSMYC
jgi:hypothetical protein